ncbi:dTDP-4-dehydrorhamnose reductase [Patescibacteria group bacterium]|nr:dTDP-4-dehydrorhamnose reductase [Patescibacteria group bacterium]MBU4601269.1 dTDP-4-dehydrorhamnose reductase [Patescibacteria group bacterium]MCG2697952.1 dTDP-4-dehydrorhamnose reductase [Candidatus Parcubacteria bacterium]
MKKILLIGKTGQIGRELIKDSASFDFEIISFNRNELDVSDATQIKEKLEKTKPDILINTSAYHVLPQCEENPINAMAINFIAVKNMAEICNDMNIKFVTYSTDYVFNGKKDSPYLENDETDPLQVYGLSKLAGEYAALNSNPNKTIIIRTNGLYGGKTGSSEKNGNFVLNIIKEADGKKEIEVSSEQIVSPTYAGDLSKATLKLLKQENETGVYHLVNEGLCSWSKFTEEIFKIAKIDTIVKPVVRNKIIGQLQRPKFTALSNTKAKSLGIELPSWQDGLKSYFNFLNNNEDES